MFISIAYISFSGCHDWVTNCFRNKPSPLMTVVNKADRKKAQATTTNSMLLSTHKIK